MNQNFEILAPAGSFETLKQVIHAGADAVYLGGEQFGARAYANNFSKEELSEALDYVHLRGKKLYLTVNTLLKNQEIDKLYDYLLAFYKKGLDAVLVQDIGALLFIHEHFCDLPIHTSTQMTVTGADGVRLLKEYGVTRVVMARETSIEEMKQIHDETGMELEAFVHGALCYSYSGQCLFSSMLGGRSGNRGRCAQPCRLPYTVLDENKKVIAKDSYILSLKDFCGIRHLDELKAAGVYSLKIEGRMKSTEYAAGVVSMYRKYVDMLCGDNQGELKSCQVSQQDYEKLRQIGNRCGFTDTYMHLHNGRDMVTFDKPSFCSENASFPVTEQYIPINGCVRLKVREPSELTIVFEQENISVTVIGPAPDVAQKKPVLKEDIRSRISKTRDTAFLFDRLDVEMSEPVFIPNGALNQLKRDGIAALEQEILKKYHRNRELDFVKHDFKKDTTTQQSKEDRYIISLEKRDLLPVALEQEWADDIYLDSGLYDRELMFEKLNIDIIACHQAGKRAYFILPYIFRRETADFFKKNVKRIQALSIDGLVAKTYEEIFFAKEYFPNADLICDHNIYTCNDYAVAMAGAWGCSRNTMPLELNAGEIKGRRNSYSQMIVYGYYPLMTTAPCVHKNTGSCDKKPGICYLKDRYQKEFAVRNCCNDCVNIVYNSLPTMLLSSCEQLRQAGVRDFRLHFSIESEEEADAICRQFGRLIKNETETVVLKSKTVYTNGHYKRGVE